MVSVLNSFSIRDNTVSYGETLFFDINASDLNGISNAEIFIMGLTAGIIDGAWYTSVALAIGNDKMVSAISKRRSLILQASGILLALISIYLLIDAARNII